MEFKNETISSKKTSDLKYKINQISVLMLCVWIALPYFMVRSGIIFFIAMCGIWLITTDLAWLTKKWPMDIVCVIIFFITFIPYFITGNLEYGEAGSMTIKVSFPMFFVGIFINHYYMYYKKDYKTLGRIALVSLITFIIGALQTYRGLQIYPMASRELAGFLSRDSELRILYNRLGIGGFGYVYACCFLLIAALYPIVNKYNYKKISYKLIGLVSFFSMLLMIFKSSYATALIFVFTGIILAMIVKNKKIFIVVMGVSAVFLIILPSTVIGEFFLKVANIFSSNNVINEKFTDLALSFLQESSSGQTGHRMELYLTSLNTFIRQPLFGIYGPFGDITSSIGGHSGWIDLLGFYGLFTGIPLFFIIYFNFTKHLKYYKKSSFYRFILVIQFLFCVFGIINPVLYIYEIGFVLFCIIPSIPFLPYAINHNKGTGR